ncbi:hypothetical protein BGZ49_010278 [Haplosporangium sp. Z 27]|nr:hypothetical protein BGZ49_010278 [Haplosporangium sp. Z 27]
MFSTTLSSLPHMMAHASSAGAPFDSEVSTADLDSEAFVTTPSATTTTNTTTTTTEDMELDMLTQLLDSSNKSSAASEKNCATTSNDPTLLSDPSVIALATISSSSSSTWASSSPSISPLVLKLESPLLTNLDGPETTSTTKSKAKGKASSSSTLTNTRKRSSNPLDKEAKARERVLRNRAAAQESRDKKRKYVSDIEATNESLQEENSQLQKRLKTVESDNLALSQRLEALTEQFAQMQQLLSQSIKQNQQGAGFCQSAVLAKKDKGSRQTEILTNSPQQKLAPQKGSLHSTTSNQAPPNKHRQVYSMTMKNLMSKKEFLNKEARSLDPSLAQNRMETSCRSFCNNTSCNQTLTLSSSAPTSFLATRQSVRQPQATVNTALMMMVFLTNILPQLMLNFSTLILISTGARLPSNPQELHLQQVVQSFIQQLFLSHRLSKEIRLTLGPNNYNYRPVISSFQTRTIKDNITSLDQSVIEEIVTEFRQGRKDLARGLLVKALLSSPSRLCNDEDIKRKMFLFRKN